MEFGNRESDLNHTLNSSPGPHKSLLGSRFMKGES